MATDSKPSDRKVTEDLLAGFDRTGRTPRTPVTKDFVDFHRKPLERPLPPPRPAEPTFVIRPKRVIPAWLTWTAIVLAMLAAGAAVAWLVRPAPPEPLPSFSRPAPPVATTTAASATATVEPPPIPTSVPAAVTQTPATGSEAAPAPAPSASTSARPPHAPPKSGFVREL